MHVHFLEGCYADPVKMRQSSFLFKHNNSGCPGLVLDHLQPIPNAEYLTFNNGNKACVSVKVCCLHARGSCTFAFAAQIGRVCGTLALKHAENAADDIAYSLAPQRKRRSGEVQGCFGFGGHQVIFRELN